MSNNESYQLSLQCRKLEGQIAQERILSQQLQASLSAEQSAHRALQAEVQHKNKEFSALRKEHDDLQKNYRILNAELEEAIGQMTAPSSRTRGSHGEAPACLNELLHRSRNGRPVGASGRSRYDPRARYPLEQH